MSGDELLNMLNIIKHIKNKKYKNAEMVKYWQTNDSVEAKVMKSKDGNYVMQMQGEKYLFPSYPRGVLLYGKLSPLKHWIKNKIFNDTWAELEQPSGKDWIKYQKNDVLNDLYALYEQGKYDAVPYEHLNPAVKEIWRAMTVVEEKTGSDKVRKLKEMMCFILNEDDAYRMRVQDLAEYFNPNSFWKKLYRLLTKHKYIKDIIKDLSYAIKQIEYAEVIGDMKERQALLRRVLLFFLEDKGVRNCFELLCKEIKWKKLYLTKADRYFFRAKYYKVDRRHYDY
jgi:hypothetical protein